MENPDLYIPADIRERGSMMKTQGISFAANLCDSLDHMLEMAESHGGEASFEEFNEVDPRAAVEFMRMASLDMWVFLNCVLEGEQTDASLMKAFMEQKAEILKQ